jgi:hypothetical protein
MTPSRLISASVLKKALQKHEKNTKKHRGANRRDKRRGPNVIKLFMGEIYEFHKPSVLDLAKKAC